MIYLTGDIHGDPRPVLRFAGENTLVSGDTVVLLGDVGANFYRSARDDRVKDMLSSIPCPILCIHGNHEMRPETIPSYETREWHGGTVYVERAWPKLLFAKDGEIYDLEGRRAIAIGGAYSVDMAYRLEMGFGWWPDEQPSEAIMRYVESQLSAHPVDVVLSHTCPPAVYSHGGLSAGGEAVPGGSPHRGMAGRNRTQIRLSGMVLRPLAHR